MNKKLIALIKTTGKTKQEIAAELEKVLKGKNMLNKNGALKIDNEKKKARDKKHA